MTNKQTLEARIKAGGGYIARLVMDKSLVGVFIAPSETDLFWALDEAGDPYQMEFAPIEGGGIFVDLSADKKIWPAHVSDDDADALLSTCYEPASVKMELSQSINGCEFEWRRFLFPSAGRCSVVFALTKGGE